MSSINIEKISITQLNTDAIVNAANEHLWEGGGVCGAIFSAAGSKEMTKACDAIGFCKTGSAVITPGFNLGAKYVIHAVGPIWAGGEANEPKLLYNAYKQSLILAKKNDIHSIGFPLISAGIYGYPSDKAWRKARQACVDFIQANQDYEISIVFAVLDDQIYTEGRKCLGVVSKEKKYIDKSKIHEFALRYIKAFSEAEKDEFTIPEEIGDYCFEFGFEMDCSKEFINVYGEKAAREATELEKIIDQIDDIFLLGSAIFSQWRYFNHWSYTTVLSKEEKQWFVIAFNRLAEITDR